jgi:protein-disulfide isomerase
MHTVLLVSRMFYPAGISLLTWMTAGVALAVLGFVASRLCAGARRSILISVTNTLAVAGIFVCLGLIGAEIVVFELGSPVAVLAYVILLCALIACIGKSRSSMPVRSAISWLVLTGCALTYLFIFGSIPDIIELKPEELSGVEGSNVLGRRSAALAVTEFGDFECPPCATQDQTMNRLWGDFSDRIRYSFRHLPKRRHPHAESAALASECAAEQSMFWETKRLLFANQDRLGELLKDSELPTIPVAGTTRYAQCIDSRSAWGKVRTDLQWAEKVGLRATPSIIVGNKLIQGVTSYPRLALIVRRELGERNVPPREQAGRVTPAGCGSELASQQCSE